MTTMMFKAPPIVLDYQALEKTAPAWERLSQNWHRLDRVELTGEQCQSLLEKVMDGYRLYQSDPRLHRECRARRRPGFRCLRLPDPGEVRCLLNLLRPLPIPLRQSPPQG